MDFSEKTKSLSLISIIVPIYNVEKYIADCLDSIVNQTYKDIEIICVNDCTMDNSMTIVKEFAENDKRIKIINNEKNRGLGGARNAGLEIANGEYFMFVDSDDMIAPTMAGEMHSRFVQDNSDMVFADFEMLNPDGTTFTFKPFHDYEFAQENKVFELPEEFEKFTYIWP